MSRGAHSRPLKSLVRVLITGLRQLGVVALILITAGVHPFVVQSAAWLMMARESDRQDLSYLERLSSVIQGPERCDLCIAARQMASQQQQQDDSPASLHLDSCFANYRAPESLSLLPAPPVVPAILFWTPRNRDFTAQADSCPLVPPPQGVLVS